MTETRHRLQSNRGGDLFQRTPTRPGYSNNIWAAWLLLLTVPSNTIDPTKVLKLTEDGKSDDHQSLRFNEHRPNERIVQYRQSQCGMISFWLAVSNILKSDGLFTLEIPQNFDFMPEF
jgi:hypothetical protein